MTKKKAATHEEDPILSYCEVARRVGKHPTTVGRWVRDGLLTIIRMPSGMPGIRESQVHAFLGGSALGEENDQIRSVAARDS
jgi:predicted site-specific integrase-resolvase